MFKEIIEESKSYVMFRFTATSKQEIENKLIDQFTKDGYKRISHSDTQITFERGSYVGRLFLGAFYKYFKWDVTINPDNDTYVVVINRQSSGMSGGLIGVSQVKNELLRLTGVIRNWN